MKYIVPLLVKYFTMKITIKKMKYLAVFLAFSFIVSFAKAQTKVLLDNYFNHETNNSGKLYHYLWSDKANSGFSQWGEIFKESGATIDTLQRAPTAANLGETSVYIIVDPDTKAETPSPHYITKEDIKSITKWVKQGGVLLLMANDSGNCEFQHLNDLAHKFGMHFNEVRRNHVAGKQWEMGGITNLSYKPVFSGIKKIYMKDASSLSLSSPAKAVLTKDGNIFMAISPIGKGYVFAITDPWIYNEYIGHKYLPESFENYQAAENLAAYLLSLSKRVNE